MTDKQILLLPTAELQPNPFQPRRLFEPQALEELAASIRANGILQPLTVRRTAEGWELIAGERRLRAAKLAGLTEVPCIPTEAEDGTSALLALLENLQREDLHYFEEAGALAAYLRRTGVSREELAASLGYSPSTLANKLRLLRLSPACAELLMTHGLSERHARALLRLEEDAERLAALRHMVSAGLNVAQTDAYIEHLVAQKSLPRGRRQFLLKDVRLFLNTVERSLKLVRTAGVEATAEREETEDAILLTIRIPKTGKPLSKAT